ncbi:MAG: hypothetical protein K6B67_03150 [Lachnospiraceae bacterium]|nr:hypothetical protein [Lachnospiraceae bacterium]
MKRKGLFKRLSSFILAVVLCLTMDNTMLSNFTSLIADASSEDILVSSNIVTEQSATTSSGSIQSNLTIPYGDNYTMRTSATNAGDVVKFYYYDKSTFDSISSNQGKDKAIEAFGGMVGNDTNVISTDSSNNVTTGIAPGSYYLAFVRTGSDDVASGFDDQYGITISKPTFNAPSGLSWDTSETDKYIAKWNAVNQTTAGATLVSDTKVQYQVSLLKDGEAVEGQTDTVTDAQYDFSEFIQEAIANKNYGKYSFSVQAVAGSGTDSNGNASNVCYNNSEMATFDTSVATIDVRNENAPTITEYVVNNSGEAIEATATDDDDAIVSFAFSTAENAGDIADSEWVSVTDANKVIDGENTTFKFDYVPTANGLYKLYVKDDFDNVGVSENSIAVTQIVYHNVYQNSEPAETSQFILGNSNKIFDLNSASRTKYNFGGWYLSEDYNEVNSAIDTSKAISKVNLGDSLVAVSDGQIGIVKGSKLDVYASWLPQALKFSSISSDDYVWNGSSDTFSAVNKYYDGNSENITVVMNAMDNPVTYHWYKFVDGVNDVEITGDAVVTESNTKTKLTVKNTTDSGNYYVKAVSTDIDGNPIEITSPMINVFINKRTVNLRLNNKTITYGDAAPSEDSYTYSLNPDDNTGQNEGFVDGESLDDVSKILGYEKGTITCTYNPLNANFRNANAVGYDITGTGFKADNYNISVISARLIVNKKNVNELNSGVLLQFKDGENYLDELHTPYTGSAITPEIVVRDSNNAAKGDSEAFVIPFTEGALDNDYEVTFTSNVNAGVATVTINFENGTNYTGTLSKTFVIDKATFDTNITIQCSGGSHADREWTYGETGSVVGIDNNPGNGSVEIHYLSGENDTTTMPINAGTYIVYAVIGETDNYQGLTTSKESNDNNTFTINPYTLTFTANSGTFEYDGNEHTVSGYTQEGEFQYADSMKYASVVGSRTDIGTSDNNITVALSDTTVASNYNIVYVPGHIEITAKALKNPSTFNWGDTVGGVNWIAVTRTNVEIQYRLRLYRVTVDEEGNDVYTLVDLDNDTNTTDDYIQTADTEYNFKDIIHADAEKYYETNNINSSLGYTTTIQTISAGGSAQGNYCESTESNKLATKYISYVTLNVDENTVDAASFGESDHAILICGESIQLNTTKKEGYDAPSATFNNEYLSVSETGIENVLNVLFKSNCNNPKDAKNQIVNLGADDSKPTITSFAVENVSDLTGFRYTFVGYDDTRVVQYAVSTATTAENVTDGEWNDISNPKKGATDEITGTITNPTTDKDYYIYVKDNVGGTDRVKLGKVYSVSFENGKTNSENESLYGGSMDTIYRLAGTEITLPENAFTKKGFAFKNWNGAITVVSTDSHGNETESLQQILIGNGGKFATDSNAVMTATWSSEEYTYEVQYYEMDVNGVYSSEPTSSATFKASYEKNVAYGSADIQAVQEGFHLDDTKYGDGLEPTSYTITDNTTVIKIYYARNQHKLTYAKTDINGDVVSEIENYYYGQTLGSELAKPEVAGYEFIGWQYSTGSRPAEMPDIDVVAEGHFNANKTNYQVVLHMQNLDGANKLDTYTIDQTLTETNEAYHASSISYAINSTEAASAKEADASLGEIIVAPKVEGFEASKIVLSNGSASNADLSQISDSENVTTSANTKSNVATGVVNQNNTLYVNIYYTRKSYDITLNVWYDGRDDNSTSGEPLFTTKEWNYPYGYVFTEADLENINNYENINSYDAETNKPEFWGERFTAKGLSGYSLASYVDWSTGNQPATMPAGDVTVTREFAQKTSANYYIELYLQGVSTVDGKNVLNEQEDGTPIYSDTATATVTSKAEIGTTISIGAGTEIESLVSSMPKSDGHVKNNATSGTDIYVNEPGKGDPFKLSDKYELLQYYDFDRAEVTSAVVPTTGELRFKMYFTRKEYTTTVNYYAEDKLIGSRDVTQAWNTSYDINPIYYFGNAVTDQIEAPGATKNYAKDGYTMYWHGRYTLPGNPNHWPGHAYKTNEEVANSYDVTDNNRYTIMSCTNNTSYNNMRVDYDPVDKTKHYQVEVEANSSDSTYKPMTYVYGGKKYEIRVANKADIFQSSLNAVDEGWNYYPGGGKLVSEYTYRTDDNGNELLRTSATASGDVSGGAQDKSGTALYTPVTINGTTYYLYDGDKAPFGDQTALNNNIDINRDGVVNSDDHIDGIMYLTVADNRFYLGNTTTFTYEINKADENQNYVGYDSVKAYYNEEITNKAGEIRVSTGTNKPTKNESGEANNWHYTYYWYDYTNLAAVYSLDYAGNWVSSGQTVSNGGHKTGDKYDVGCTSLETLAPSGYTVEWYTKVDDEYVNKTGATNQVFGKTNTEYIGRFVANTVNNHAHISYELPEPIKKSAGSDEEVSYVTSDNVNTIAPNGSDKVSWVKCDLGTDEDDVLEKAVNAYDVVPDETKSANKYLCVSGLVKQDFKYLYGTTSNEVTIEKNAPFKAYYIDGVLVYIDQTVFTPAGGTAELAYADYNSTGLTYDKTNNKNKLKVYVPTGSHGDVGTINLYAYYSRSDSSMILDNDNTEVKTTTTDTYKYQQEVSLETPIKPLVNPGTYTGNPYTFDHWDFSIWDATLNNDEGGFDTSAEAEAIVNGINTSTTGVKTTFTMPVLKENQSLYVKAIYTPGTFSKELPYYFAKVDGSYNTSLITECKAVSAENKKAATLNINNSNLNGYVYYDTDNEPIGVSYTYGVTTYYFEDLPDSAYTVNGDDIAVNVDTIYLTAATVTTEFTSEATLDEQNYVDKISADNLQIFGFAYAGYKYKSTIANMTAAGDIDTATGEAVECKAKYNMDFAMYFNRVANLNVRTTYKVNDGGAVSAKVSGQKYYYFGEEASLKVTPDAGYDFVAWYKAEDVLEGYATDKANNSLKALGSYDLKTDISAATKLVDEDGDDTVYTFNVETAGDYVALLAPSSFTDGTDLTASISGKSNYEYGYSVKGINNKLTVSVDMTHASEATAVTGYQWYEIPAEYVTIDTENNNAITVNDESKWVELNGETGASYSFPEGKVAGKYYYRCDVGIKRSDNDRTGIVMAPTFNVTVSPFSQNYVSSQGYNDYYDGESHGISVVSHDSSFANVGPANYTVYVVDEDALTTDDNYIALKKANPQCSNEEIVKMLYDQLKGNTDSLNALFKNKVVYENRAKVAGSSNPLEYKDVELNGNNSIKVHNNYYVVVSEDPNYGIITGKESVVINPIRLVAKATSNVYSKTYDGTTDITGYVTDGKGHESTDKYRLSRGEGNKKYYTLTGFINDTEADTYTLDFDGQFAYDNAHVSDATSLVMRNLRVVKKTDGTETNNYYMDGEINLSATISQYQLAVKWDNDHTYKYNGLSQGPTAYFVDENGNRIEGNLPNAPINASDLVVTGHQIYTGSFTAYAELVGNANYSSSDFKLANYGNTNGNFEIVKCPITVTPNNLEMTYNGASNTINSYSVKLDGIDVSLQEEASYNGKFVTANDGTKNIYQKFTVSNDTSKKDVGTYTVTAKNLKIYDESGIDVTGNYDITLGSGTLTINKKVINVSGLQASNKTYDGNSTADVVYDTVVFNDSENVDNGKLQLDDSKVSATFITAENDSTPSALAADNKWVSFVIASDALVGDAAKNYTLDVDASQKLTNASIYKKEVSVGINDVTAVYGENPEYGITYDGFISGESENVISSPVAVVYNLKDSDNNVINPTSYNYEVTGNTISGVKLPVVDGGYKIGVNTTSTVVSGQNNQVNLVDGISADNYFFTWNGATAKLTVTPREVSVEGVNRDPAISKVYDGTTDATALVNKASDIRFIEATSNNGKGLLQGDTLELADVSAAFNSMNVEAANKITISGISLGSDSNNLYKSYSLANNSVEVAGEISPKPLTLELQNKEATYGAANDEIIYTARLSGYISSDVSKYPNVNIAAMDSDENGNPEYYYKDVTAADGILTITSLYDSASTAAYVDDNSDGYADNASRGAGAYKISASDFVRENTFSKNYTIASYDPTATLTINKKELTVKADDKSIVYGINNVPTTGWVYGEDKSNAKYSYSIDGFEYDDTNADLTYRVTLGYTCYESGTTKVSNTTDYKEDGYAINLTGVDQMTSPNYTFEAKAGKYMVKKQYLSVKGVTARDKVYDGTNRANIVIVGNDSNDASTYNKGLLIASCYVSTEPSTEVNLAQMIRDRFNIDSNVSDQEILDANIKIIGAYEDPDVGESKPIDLTMSLVTDSDKDYGNYLAKNYVLYNDENMKATLAANGVANAELCQDKVPAGIAKINQRKIRFKANDKTIKYGTNLSDDTNSSNYYSWKSVTPIVADVDGKTDEYNKYTDGFAKGVVRDENGNVIDYSADSDTIDSFKLADGVSEPGYVLHDYKANDTDGYSPVGNYVISPAKIVAKVFKIGSTANYDVKSGDPDKATDEVDGGVNGTLTVVKNKLKTPVVTWSNADAGVATWSASPKIGAVNVAKYTYKLYKNGESTPVATGEVDADKTSVNLLETIRSNGAGTYTLGVTAVAVTGDVNVNNKNVADSEEGKTDQNNTDGAIEQIYARNVSFAFASDDVTTEASTNVKTTKVGSADVGNPYVVVDGESGVDLVANWSKMADSTEYKSGYKLKSITAQSGEDTLEGLTITNGTGSDADGQNGRYAGTFAIPVGQINNSNDIAITIGLDKRVATLSGSITSLRDSVMYGYTYEGAPKYTINVTSDTDDATDAYTYTYEWSYKKGVLSPVKMQSSESPTVNTSDSWVGLNKNNKGFNVYKNNKGEVLSYKVLCKVIATRKDNGESITKTFDSTMTINPANIDAVTVNIAGWTYGEARNTPKLSVYIEELEGENYSGSEYLTYEYREDKLLADWSEVAPVNPGNYQVRAVIKGAPNYADRTTDPTDYTISKAKLATPTNLLNEASNKAAYGLAKWNTVPTFAENAGAIGASDSSVTVGYVVKLYSCDDSYNIKELIKTYEQSDVDLTTYASSNQACLDMSADMNEKGKYCYTVQAIANDTDALANNETDIHSAYCDDSEVTSQKNMEVSDVIEVHISTDPNGDDLVENGKVDREYNSQSLTMKVKSSTSGFAYQWMKDGVAISGATDSTYTIKYVGDSGVYSCRLISQEKTYDTTYVTVKITPRPIVLSSVNAEKSYDGTPLTLDGWWIKQSGNESGNNHKCISTNSNADGNKTDNDVILDSNSSVISTNTVTGVNVVGTQTNATTGVDNVIDYSNVVIKEGEVVVYNSDMVTAETANYTISVEPGKLVINKANQTIDTTATTDTTAELVKSYTFDGKSHNLTGAFAYGLGGVTDTTTGDMENPGVGTITYAFNTSSSMNENADGSELSDVTQISAGKKVIRITAAETLNYSTTSVDVVLHVIPKQLANIANDSTSYGVNVNGISVEDIADVDYSGEAYTPTPTVTFKVDEDTSYTLDGDDLTYSYSNNVNAGIATVTITGKNNYAGVITKTFNINKVNQSIDTDSVTKTFTYDGKPHSLDGAFAYGVNGKTDINIGSATEPGVGAITYAFNNAASENVTSDGSASSDVDQTNVGKKIITVTAAETLNYNAATISLPLEVTKKNIGNNTSFSEGITVDDVTGLVYNGTYQMPEPAVKYTVGNDVIILTKGNDFDYSYTDNVHAGEATIKITAEGNYDGEIIKTFNIAKKDLKLKSDSAERVYNYSPLTAHGYTIDNVAGLASNDSIVENTPSYTGTQTDVLYTNDQVGSSKNNFGSVEIKNSVDAIGTTTDDYNITYITGDLKVTPRGNIGEKTTFSAKMTLGGVEYANNAFNHLDNNALIEPVITIYDDRSDINSNWTELYELTKGTDYEITGTTSAKEVNPIGENYTFTVTLKGNYQGSFDVNWSIKDVKDPTAKITIGSNWWDSLLETVTFGIYKKEVTDVKLEAEDEVGGSGIDKIYYYVMDKTSTKSKMTLGELQALDASSWTEISNGNTFSISPEREVVVYAKVSDKAGNVTYISSNGVVLETIPPTITGISAGKTYCLEHGFSVSDNYEVDSVKVNGYTVLPINGVYTLAAVDTFGKIAVESGASNSILVTDKAGNTTEYTGIVINATHTWLLSNDGADKAVAKCAIDTCGDYHNASDITAIINATSKTYDGAPVNATITKSDKFSGFDTQLIVDDIKYYKTSSANETSGGTLLSGAPKNAGYYYAEAVVTTSTSNSSVVISKPFEITPVDISDNNIGTLTIEPNHFTYDASTHGPTSIIVKAKVDGVDTTLVENQDYKLTNDVENHKQKTAVEVGTYTIEVVGKGNFTGSRSVTYEIEDEARPTITGIEQYDNTTTPKTGIYCEDKTVKIADPNLTSVVITKRVGTSTSDETVVNDTFTISDRNTSGVDIGKVVGEYTLTGDDGVDGTDSGVLYTITATDVSSNVITYKVMLYEDHAFTNYVPDETAGSYHKTKTACCNHECGATDVADTPWGTIEWDYRYEYPTDNGLVNGVQEVENRATFARIRLIRVSDGQTIATKIVKCDDECGVPAGANAKDVGSVKYYFNTYDPNNASYNLLDLDGDVGTTPIPHYDESGNEIGYIIDASPIKKLADGSFVGTDEYNFEEHQSFNDADDMGYKKVFNYTLGCFNLPWEVTISDIPVVDGVALVPDSINVKVLYAEDENAQASDYAVITQQAGGTSEGTSCAKSDVVINDDGTASAKYTGYFPVWRFQAGTHDTYYHRIQVVAFNYAGSKFDLDNDEKYKSICDDDHVNHTVYYDKDADAASGTIKLDLSNLTVPSVIFDYNLGSDIINQAVEPNISSPHMISKTRSEYDNAKANGTDFVTADEINSRNPVGRANYNFLGWYTLPSDGTKVSKYGVDELKNPTRVYAHWKETVKPNASITMTSDQVGSTEFIDSSNINFDTYYNAKQVVTINAVDDGMVNGVQTGVINSGIDKIEYKIIDATLESAISENDLSSVTDWTTYTKPLNINANGRYIVYAKISDKAGNVRYISTDGFNVDVVLPSITGVTSNKNYCEAKEITFSDENLVAVTVNGNPIDISTGKYTLVADGTTYNIEAVDKAGNVSKIENVTVYDGHEWSEPVFNWPSVNSKATATFTCIHDNTHVDVEDCVITSEETKAPTEVENGEITYTATVTKDGKTYSMDKVVSIEKLDSSIGDNGESLDTEIIVESHAPDTEVTNLTVDTAADTTTQFKQDETILNGNDILVYLEVAVTYLENVIKEGHEDDIEEKLLEFHEDAVVGKYLDVSLFLRINNSEPEKLPTTYHNPLTLEVQLDEELKNTNPDVERHFTVVRVHDYEENGVVKSKADILPTEYDTEKNTIKFTTNLFSTYAICYYDTDIKTANDDNSISNDGDSNENDNATNVVNVSESNIAENISTRNGMIAGNIDINSDSTKGVHANTKIKDNITDNTKDHSDKQDTDIVDGRYHGDVHDCYWHIIILIITIGEVVILLVLKKNKRNKKYRFLTIIVGGILDIICVYLGCCYLDIPFAIIGTVISLLVLLLKKKKDEDEDGEDTLEAQNSAK